MKKKPRPRPATKAIEVAYAFRPLIGQVRDLIQSARRLAAASVHTIQVRTNFEIGRLIVEHEQKGAARAKYGKETLKVLASNLTKEFGRGFSEDNLSRMRKFYLLWQDRPPQLSQTAPTSSPPGPRSQTTADPSGPISATLLRKFTLSWSHYLLLLGIRNPEERSFYEIEATRENWSLSELKRQVASCLYERLALSRDKKRVRELAEKGHVVTQPADILKEPYVLEFLGLDEKPGYSETDL